MLDTGFGSTSYEVFALSGVRGLRDDTDATVWCCFCDHKHDCVLFTISGHYWSDVWLH